MSGLCPIFIMVCSTFYFPALQVVVLHFLESLFARVHLHLFFLFFFYLVLYLQLVGSSEAQKILPARGTAYIFNRLCPIFITVCFQFYFLAFHLVSHYFRITFFMKIFFFLGHVPLASRILGGFENSTGQRYRFVHLR